MTASLLLMGLRMCVLDACFAICWAMHMWVCFVRTDQMHSHGMSNIAALSLLKGHAYSNLIVM